MSDGAFDNGPVAVARLRAAVAEAEAVFFATSEYNSSIPGALKNTLDRLSRPYATNAIRNKPVAVVGASTGMFGAVWAQADLRTCSPRWAIVRRPAADAFAMQTFLSTRQERALKSLQTSPPASNGVVPEWSHAEKYPHLQGEK